jgi:SAM-dependent methyltransferase
MTAFLSSPPPIPVGAAVAPPVINGREPKMSYSKEWFENDRLWAEMQDIFFDFDRWDAAIKENDSLIKTLEINPGAHILDLCCGPGRHTIDLARRGYKVTGVDRTESYLIAARDKAAWEGLEVELVQEDMRRFVRPEAFDVVINMFTSFGYFENPEEETQVAANVYRSLKPGGRWIIDLIGKEVLARIFQARDWEERGDVIVLEERKPSADWSHMNSRWILIKGGQIEEFDVSLRMFSATELADLLKSVGFSSVSVYGDLDGAPYDHKARRLITVAHK